MLWSIANPIRSRQVKEWAERIGTTIAALEEEIEPDCVLAHFSMLAPMMWADRNVRPGLFGRIPHVMLYFYPGIPNRTAPWLFDGRLRSLDFCLYDKTTDDVIIDSWSTILARMSMANGIASDNPKTCTVR